MNPERPTDQSNIPPDVTPEGWENLTQEAIYGDIRISDILDSSQKRVFDGIKEMVQNDFSDVKTHLGFDEFSSKLRNFYQADEASLHIINQGLELMKQKYEATMNEYNRKATKPAAYDWENPGAYKELAEKLGEKDAFTSALWITDKLNQAEALYYIAAFLKGTTLNEERPNDDLREALSGKKILVLGDDTGSLSEVLQKYGAEGYGIEIDEFKVLIAHSGILAQDGKPQQQVLQGDIGDFFNAEGSTLLDHLKKLGPFDMIVSRRVFNSGSGIEKLSPIKTIKANQPYSPGRASGDEVFKILRSIKSTFQRNADSLLNDGGLQLHTEVDMDEVFRHQYVWHSHNSINSQRLVVIPKNMIRGKK